MVENSAFSGLKRFTNGNFPRGKITYAVLSNVSTIDITNPRLIHEQVVDGINTIAPERASN
jgi:hypothetical protein